MANVSERCEISRQSTPGALYWAAREPSDPRALAVYWQLLTVEHRGICAVKANGQRLTPGRWNITAKGDPGVDAGRRATVESGMRYGGLLLENVSKLVHSYSVIGALKMFLVSSPYQSSPDDLPGVSSSPNRPPGWLLHKAELPVMPLCP